MQTVQRLTEDIRNYDLFLLHKPTEHRLHNVCGADIGVTTAHYIISGLPVQAPATDNSHAIKTTRI